LFCRKENIYGQNIGHRAITEKAQIPIQGRPALFSMRPETRLYEGLRPLPHMLPRIRQRRRDTGNKEIVMVTDPISDLIVRIQNGSRAGKPSVTLRYSKFADNVAHALKKAGYISTVEKKGKPITEELVLGLVVGEGGPRIHGVERVSKPSRRIYQKYSDIRTYRSGFGNVFFSTPKGVLPDMEAKKFKVGGEVLFRIW
jgi:small subunit ribosomal protein S8